MLTSRHGYLCLYSLNTKNVKLSLHALNSPLIADSSASEAEHREESSAYIQLEDNERDDQKKEVNQGH